MRMVAGASPMDFWERISFKDWNVFLSPWLKFIKSF